MTERIPRIAGRAVMLLSAVLALIEVGRVGLAGDTAKTLVAVAAAAAFMPIHLWHLSYGVRGERPPHSGPTLAAMAVVHLVALIVIGASWSFMLAVLATSALVVLRPRWSLGVLGACVLAPLVVTWAEPGSAVGFSSTAAYLMYSVLFRAAIQFAMVWLVAAVYQLAASRTALAADAVLEERTRLQLEVRASLERHLAGLRDAGRRARDSLRSGGVAEPLIALDAVLAQAAEALSDLRALVSETRAARSETAAVALVRTVRAWRSPIGRGLATRQAWRSLVGVHTIALLFPLLMCVGAFGFAPARHEALAVLAWLALTAMTLSASLAVAGGAVPSRPHARVAVAAGIVFGLIWVFGIAWETSSWFVSIAAVVCLSGRTRIALVLASMLGMLSYDTVTWLDSAQPSTYGLVWNAGYWLTVSSLAIGGVCASAGLVPIVAELDAARDALAASAVRSERRRMSRDLHDVLGQSLTAISLKGDLARRLIGVDARAAAREIGELEAVATSLTAEIEAVGRNEREVEFATEAGAAVDLLRLAGIDVRATLEVNGMAPDASAVLGFAVREGATNILRHADARCCTIHAVRRQDVIRLDLVNDGAGARRTAGTGLQNLADRLAELDGRAAGEALGGGRFRLRVEVPA